VLRYSAFYRTMKQWLDEGRLGELISLEFNETLAPYHGAAMHGNWRRHAALAGPMIMEKCCHDMDIMLWLTGSRPARVASFGGLTFFKAANAHYNDLYPVGEQGYRYYDRGLATGFAVGTENNITPFNDDKDTVDHQVAILELENRVRASFHFCMHSARLERRFYLCGTRGTIRGDVLTGVLEYTPVGWKPQTDVVRMIHAFALARFDWEPACDQCPSGGANRKQHGLLDGRGVDVRRERLAVDHDVNATCGVVCHDLHSSRVLARERQRREQKQNRCGECAGIVCDAHW